MAINRRLKIPKSGKDEKKIQRSFELLETEVNKVVTDLDDEYLQLSGDNANQDIDIGSYGLTSSWLETDYVDFDLAFAGAMQEGRMAWDGDAGTLTVGMPGGNVVLQLGQEIYLPDRPKNVCGAEITNGEVVYLSGATGAVPEVCLANASNNTAPKTIAVATETVADNQRGYYTVFGVVREMDTSFGSDGDEVFLDTTDGGLTVDKLDYPNIRVKIGYIIRSHATEGVLFVNIDPEQWLQRFQVMKMPTGFPNRTESTIAYNPSTRTITVTPTGTEFNYFLNAQRYRVSSISETHPDVTGVYFLYYDSTNTLQFSTTLWNIRTDVPISYAVYNSSLADGFCTDERHGTDRSSLPWHYSDHFTRGSYWHNGEGLGIADYTLQPSTPANSDNQFSISSGHIHDEDIDLTLSALATGSYKVFYRSGASGEWLWATETVPLLASNVYIDWNEWTGSTWQQTESATNNYGNMYVGQTGAIDTDFEHFVIQGQAIHSTLLGAQAESANSLDLSGLPFQEIVFSYKITFRTNASYTTTGKCRIESVEDTRLSTSRQIISGSTINNHNSLGGLQLAGTGVDWGHIDDVAQTIAGEKTFTDDMVIDSDATIIKDGNGWTYTNEALTLKNTTEATSTTTRQYPPAIVLEGNEYASSTSKSVRTYFAHESYNGSNSQVTNLFLAQYNNGTIIRHPFKIVHTTSESNGRVLFSVTGQGENRSNPMLFANNATATSSTDEWAPGFLFYGSGWETDTATAMRCSIGAHFEMHKGSASPRGKLVFSGAVDAGTYQINDDMFSLAVSDDEGKTGVFLNENLRWSDFQLNTENCARVVESQRTTDATYDVTATDYFVITNTDSNATTVNLPAGVDGRMLIIKNTGSSGNNVTVDGDSSETIEGSTTYTLYDGDSITIIYNSTDGWLII